jgi:uncharacterized protein YjbJ (UPF0337 family)
MDRFRLKEGPMNKDELKGKGENLKGRVKEAAGALSGDKRTQAEGLVDRVRGAVREKVGKGKEKVSRDVSRDPDEDE